MYSLHFFVTILSFLFKKIIHLFSTHIAEYLNLIFPWHVKEKPHLTKNFENCATKLAKYTNFFIKWIKQKSRIALPGKFENNQLQPFSKLNLSLFYLYFILLFETMYPRYLARSIHCIEKVNKASI